MTKTQIFTVLFLLAYSYYELHLVRNWGKTTPGHIVRVDLCVIIPIIVILVTISLVQLVRRRESESDPE
ncbi:hypothetical protein [Mucilaginibacter agri]|uniref:Uncharacterized protein n=1 Tax=Mucilaginibacter agri TaxID=2695265 RepID=A0A966DQW9_9SPHI|nr:hypothetical protein [Mucilaginibacter agri]NCD68438.1 hypothetical protein [Mucilaginibacter agri]